MNNPLIEISKNFSLGNFESVFQNFADDVVWNIIDENTFIGKSDVMSNCKQTTDYFNSVETNFITETIIAEKNKVVIIGSAEFLRKGERLSFVKASDLYEFNNEGKLIKVSSYCIEEK